MFQNCEEKLKNQQQLKQTTIYQKLVLFASNSSIYKQRKELFKILLQSISISSNALLLTRIRFTQLINFCFSLDQTLKFECNSVFSSLNEQQDTDSIAQDQSYELNQLPHINQEEILTLAQNQFKADSSSFLNTLRIIAPIYLIMSLCFNIIELANKKQKIDIFILFLCLITVSDLIFFNSAYSFSNLKPNRSDSELFNSNVSTYNMQFLSSSDQEILQYASNNIFLIANRAIILYSFMTRVVAILINFVKLYNNTKSLQSSKLGFRRIVQNLKQSSPKKDILQQSKQGKKQEDQNQKEMTPNQNQVQKNSLNQNSRKSSQETKQAQKSMNIQQKQKKQKINETTAQPTSLLAQKQDNSNKKCKENTKNQQKNIMEIISDTSIKNACKQQKNTKIIQNQEPQLVQQQVEKKNKSTNQKKKNFTQKNEKEAVELNYQEQQLQYYPVELCEIKIENKMQQEFYEEQNIGSDNRENINEIQNEEEILNTDQITHASVIQNLNSQIFLDSIPTTSASEIPQIQQSQVKQNNNSNQFNTCVSSPDISCRSQSPDMNCSIISPIIAKSNNQEKTNDTPPTIYISLNQNSDENADFSLNDQTCSNRQSLPTNLSTSQTNILLEENQVNSPVNHQQQQIDSQNEIYNEQNRPNIQIGDQLIIEQVNEELRKKWMLKQKASKLKKKNLNSSSTTLQSIHENSINNNSNFINQSQLSQNDHNLSYIQIGSHQQLHNINLLPHDQQYLQEDLDISTNDESNFNSINSNYDGQIITKPNNNPANLKSLSQHLLNQQASYTLTHRQQQQQQQLQYQQHYASQTNGQQSFEQAGFSEILNQENGYDYQKYSEQQYHEEQCYNAESVSRTQGGLQTCGQKSIQQRQNQFYEDNYQDPSQKCFEEFIKMNQGNLLKQQHGQTNQFQNQQGSPFQFYYEDEEQCQGQENKTPFEIFYDQQCMIDEDYDEEEELDQFQENLEDDDEEEEDDDDYNEDEDDDDEDDDDDDEEEEENENKSKQNQFKRQNFSANSKCTNSDYIKANQNKNYGLNHNLECGMESNPDNNSTFQQSQLQNTEIYSMDELKSHLGDYLDMMNDSSLTNNDLCMKKYDLNLSMIGNQEDQEEGTKTKKKKKKSKEQKRKRRCKRKLKKRLERSMMETDIQSVLGNEKIDLNTSINQSICQSNANKSQNKVKSNNKSNNSNAKRKQVHKNNNNVNNKQFSKICGDQMANQYFNYNGGYSLKRMLDENLLEYFTFTVNLQHGVTVNIYITDFYQFDEQFEMQSCIYGIDSSTILDVKINLIFEILSQNLYPNMNNFFEHLISNYSMTKLATNFNQQSLQEYMISQESSELTELVEQYLADQDLKTLVTENMNGIFSQENNIYDNQLILTQ